MYDANNIKQFMTALFFGLFFCINFGHAQVEETMQNQVQVVEFVEENQDSIYANYASKRFKKNIITSYYSGKLNGRKTSSGAVLDNQKYTAAHRSLPFGTKVRLTNPQNKQSVVVEINDRGPFSKVKEIDITQAAFKKLAPLGVGLLRVDMEILIPEKPVE
jgi:rare lipoprotein A